MKNLLSLAQIIEILKKKVTPSELNNCKEHDIRAVFHTVPTQLENKLLYYSKFIEWVKQLIDGKKHAVFKSLFQLPVETVDFTEGIFDEFTKIFEAQNRFLGFQFTNPELIKDFEEYRKVINDHTFWKTRGFQALKSAINSFMIIDLPKLEADNSGNPVQVSRYPEPYYYLLDVQKVRAVDIDNNFNVNYILFEDPANDNVYHYFDSLVFSTYEKEKDKEEYKLISSVPHDLGYCPARSFWTTPFNSTSLIQKKGPLSNSLTKLDWLLFKYVSSKHLELYAGFPIYLMYEQQCNYTTDAGDRCNGGFVETMVKPGHGQGGSLVSTRTPCPICKDKSILGAGSVLLAPPPADKDDPDVLDGVKIVNADVESLERMEKSIDRYETMLAWNIIGFSSDMSKEAMNEKQVQAGFESRVNVLMEVKENFERIHQFVIETVCKLRYGSAFIGATVNYGDKFFLHSVEQLQAQYKESKGNGFPNFELSAQVNQILITKYKNNPDMMERVRILAAIEPYINYNTDDLSTLHGSFPLKKELVYLKMDFENYVNRFEREYMNMVQFMQFSTFETKVEFIRAKLVEYVIEDYKLSEQPAAAPAIV